MNDELPDTGQHFTGQVRSMVYLLDEPATTLTIQTDHQQTLPSVARPRRRGRIQRSHRQPDRERRPHVRHARHRDRSPVFLHEKAGVV